MVNLQPRERILRCNCMTAPRWLCLRCCAKDNAEDTKREHPKPNGGLAVSVLHILSYGHSLRVETIIVQSMRVHCLWRAGRAATPHGVQLVLEHGLGP